MDGNTIDPSTADAEAAVSREKIERDIGAAWGVLKTIGTSRKPILETLADIMDPEKGPHGETIETTAEEVYELEIIDGKATLRDGAGDVILSDAKPEEARAMRERLRKRGR